MPREPKPPRLWFRKPRKAQNGRSAEKGVYVILANGRQYSTGCGKGDREGAEKAIAEFFAAKHVIPKKRREIEEIPIADVLNLYLQDRVPSLATAHKAAGRIDRLLDWWGAMMLDEVTGSNCRRFAAERSNGAARRELQDLQAAINYHHREGLHREYVLVTLPPAGEARQRWLTRAEVAKLIRICLHTPEIQEGRPTDKRPLRHLARFILFSVHTGSRPNDAFNASFVRGDDRGFIDFDTGLFVRRPPNKKTTKKRQPTTPLPPELLFHLKRWRKNGSEFVIEFEGKKIKSVKTAFARLVQIAKLPGEIVPYTLRHTCATWKKQAGHESWQVGGFIGTSEAMIERHYGHHDPVFLKAVASTRPQRPPKEKPKSRQNDVEHSGTET